jgi:hypothetical protein
VLGVLGVALIVGLLVVSRTQAHGFFADIIDKFQSMVTEFFGRI